jgi:WD40 repeat protein
MDAVNTIMTTSSNIIISVSNDKSIMLFDYNYRIIQKIENAHNGIIFDIALKDDNNFATCSQDKSIKTWRKSLNDKYLIDKVLNNIHDNDIHKIEYLKNDTIISGSKDMKIKIWNLINNEYKCTLVLNNNIPIYSLLYSPKENILISAGTLFTRIWDTSNLINPLISQIDVVCHGKNALQKLDDNRVVFGGRFEIKIISIKEKQVSKKIKSAFLVWAICVIENKQLFICGGVSNDLEIFSSINYENLGLIKNCHNGNLRGISLLNNGKIITGSEDKKTKIWKIII